MTIAHRLLSRSLQTDAERVHGLAEIFKTLGDPTRLKILAALGTRERCVHDLCVRLHMSQPAVSHQLRILRSERLVKPRRAGREIFYSLDDAHVMVLIEEGLKHAGHRRGAR
ncbi:MAG TPA: metalloregulator ArsR/SmtB family transcription factor [Polyangia bacterium]|nr:metalloregulator ArsR/SmtB family transcription factor [Polyangia bacterium]